MDENRTDFFSNTPDDTVSHGADSVQPPLSEQTDAVVSMKQEQEPATQSQATSAMPTDAAGQMRAQATQHAQQTVDSFFGTQNPNGCTYAYGRAQQPQAQPQPHRHSRNPRHNRNPMHSRRSSLPPRLGLQRRLFITPHRAHPRRILLPA